MNTLENFEGIPKTLKKNNNPKFLEFFFMFHKFKIYKHFIQNNSKLEFSKYFIKK